MSQPSIGVVIPAYRPDPGETAAYIRDIRERMAPDRIRIEIDAPRPGVVDRLERTGATVNVSTERRGKGAAITDGFDALETDILAFVDSDGSVPAASAADLLPPLLDDAADLVVGSRRHPAADIRFHASRTRKILGDGFAWMARRMMDPSLHDYQCGAKAIRSGCWEAFRPHISEPGFGWDLELIGFAHRHGRVEEVPVAWEDRHGSTVSLTSHGWRIAQTLFTINRRLDSAGE